MFAQGHMVLGAVVFWCAVLGVVGDDDDDWCFYPARNRTVRASDCPNNCCIDDECGTRSECTAVLLVVLAVIGSVVCCAVVASVVVCFVMRCCCFAPHQQMTYHNQAPFIAQQPVAHFGQQPVTGYPAGQYAPPAQPGVY